MSAPKKTRRSPGTKQLDLALAITERCQRYFKPNVPYLKIVRTIMKVICKGDA